MKSEGTIRSVARGSAESHEISVDFASGPLMDSEVVIVVEDREAFSKLNISPDMATMQGKPLQNVRVKIEFY